MSTTLYWEPVKKGRVLSNKLRDIIVDRFGTPCQIGLGSREYIKGLIDAGVEDAQKLLDALDKYKKIRLWIES